MATLGLADDCEGLDADLPVEIMFRPWFCSYSKKHYLRHTGLVVHLRVPWHCDCTFDFTVLIPHMLWKNTAHRSVMCQVKLLLITMARVPVVTKHLSFAIVLLDDPGQAIQLVAKRELWTDVAPSTHSA